MSFGFAPFNNQYETFTMDDLGNRSNVHLRITSTESFFRTHGADDRILMSDANDQGGTTLTCPIFLYQLS
jgi:hypothetical protein